MSNRNTIYERHSPKGKRNIRLMAKLVPCPYCKAPEGKPCVGIGGHPAKPHSQRIVDGATEEFWKKVEER